jgi:hypothetical protein
MVAQTEQITDTERKNYVYELRPQHVSHFNRPGRCEISANCDFQRFFGPPRQAAKISAFAGSDRTKGLRDLALARTGTGL